MSHDAAVDDHVQAEDRGLVDIAVEIAAEAAHVALAGLGDEHRVATKASRLDLVTEVDTAVEALIVDRLRAQRPRDGIIGEEGAAHAGSTGIDWIVDPIDGTTSFVYGLPGFSVSIAAQRRGQTVASVVHAPAISSVYVGGPDGVTHNDRPVKCSDQTHLADALIATGFSPLDERRRRQSRHVAELLPEVRDLRRMGSAALDLAAVAAGQLDAYYEVGLAHWDWAAGAHLVEAAGGLVITEPVESGRHFVIAAAPGLAAAWVSLLRSLGADQA